jgi:hypothetical protein
MDEVAKEIAKNGRRCGLRVFLNSQPKADAAEFLRIIKSGDVATTAIWRALVKRGFVLGGLVIGRHRINMCRECYPPKKGKA